MAQQISNCRCQHLESSWRNQPQGHPLPLGENPQLGLKSPADQQGSSGGHGGRRQPSEEKGGLPPPRAKPDHGRTSHRLLWGNCSVAFKGFRLPLLTNRLNRQVWRKSRWSRRMGVSTDVRDVSLYPAPPLQGRTWLTGCPPGRKKSGYGPDCPMAGEHT